MAGLSNSGWQTKRLPEVITDLREEAAEIFQDLLTDPNDVVDTSGDTTLGRLIGLVSPSLADVWEAAQGVYSAFDPNSATGIALDNLVAIGGITRKPASPTTAVGYFEGDLNASLYSGVVVKSTVSGAEYTTGGVVGFTPNRCQGIGVSVRTVDVSNSYTIRYRLSVNTPYIAITVSSGPTPSVETILAAFEAEIANNHNTLTTYRKNGRLYIQAAVNFQQHDFTVSSNLKLDKVVKAGSLIANVVGAIEDPAGSISTILTPVLGWDSITNPQDAEVGSLVETDEELRTRFRNTKFQRATNISESLYSAIFALDGVNNIVLYENDTNAVNEYGVLPHSFLTLIDGGVAEDIAQAIWQNRPVGIASQGNTAVNITDAFGFTRTIHFSRPVHVDVFIEIDIETNAQFPQSGEDLIREALVSYINNLTINDDVVYSRLYTPINSVPGHQVNGLRIGTSVESLGYTNIVTNFDEIPKTANLKITFV